MKVIVEDREKLSRRQLEKKSQAVLNLIGERTETPRRQRLHLLAEAFFGQAVVSPIHGQSAEEIFSWVDRFLDFLEQRRSDIAIDILSYGESGRSLLMTNCPDARFLVDSLQNELKKQDYRFRVVFHPMFTVERRQGEVAKLADLGTPGPRESFILLEGEGLSPQHADELVASVRRLLAQVLQVERDRKELEARMGALAEQDSFAAHKEFLSWLQGGNFLPFAYRCRRMRKTGNGAKEICREGESLGLAEEAWSGAAAEEQGLTESDAGGRTILAQTGVVVEPLTLPSPLHRPDPLTFIGFHQPLSGGDWIEHGFLGLFSQLSENELTFDVAPLRSKIEQALDTLMIPPGSFDYGRTFDILNTFPKVELFFMEQEELEELVRSFISMELRDGVKVVATRSLSLRGLTLLVILPREYYSPESLRRMENYLCRYFKAPQADFRIIHVYSDYLSLHVRLVPRRTEVRLAIGRLERGLTDLARPWELRLRMQLERSFGAEKGRALWRKYGASFSDEYRSLIHPRYALRDVRGLERLLRTKREVFDLWGPFTGEQKFYRIQFYSGKESYLNELMPLLENLGLSVIDEVDFTIELAERRLFIKSFSVRSAYAAEKNLARLKKPLLEVLAALRSGRVENDYLNRLLIPTGLSWRQIDVFRAYRNYYFQLGSPFTKRRVAFSLIHNPKIALLLYRYFEARFVPAPEWADPMLREEQALSPIRQQLVEALEQVGDINEDRILRTLFNLFDSTVRTNFFLRHTRKDYFLSFKISALGIIDMPFPRPMYETYVHSEAMEGIHLRGGKVARGGIRWSDRPDDFRTEVLGLLKAQMTKNTLIVPVGSKGGFVVKTPFKNRDKGAKLSREAYKTLMHGLLDLTDNLVEGKVVRPEGIVAYDDQDPYLVVAADKGTAHLPDTANEVSAAYDFWLGDAFASGGSRGYDHKKLGITARGAWECVKRHFRELGKDIQREPFTVVGIGDMSGDVFGNGMLLSQQIRLRAAFDHRHIFIDPDPDPARSYAERQRLFALPRSSWEDYDRSLISEGGGVWPRSAKEIPLSPPVRQWLGVRHASLDGEELIRRLLTAETELLWNGGIGTYVKASSEKNEEVGDRANDPVRVDAERLQAAVVGEGGNLGFTQRARIEFALAGGRINTDSIDNSGGVDVSDHEVNLKILMQQLLEQERIASLEERDGILEEVTGEVCAGVLHNNYTQSLGISLDRLRCGQDVEPFLDLTDRLVNAGLLDRQGEFLPSRKEVMARSGDKFTRPELAVLLSYSKMQLFQALQDDPLPDHPGVRELLGRYFPAPVRERFGEELENHPLRREIIATMITNLVTDQGGSAFLSTVSRRTGASIAQGASAYLTFDRVLGGEAIRRQVFALDNRLEASEQYRVLLGLEEALSALCLWALQHDQPSRPDATTVEGYIDQYGQFRKILGGILREQEWQEVKDRIAFLVDLGLDPVAAEQVAVLKYAQDFLPLVALASRTGCDIYAAARTLIDVRRHLGVSEMREMLGEIRLHDRWDRLAAQALDVAFTTSVYRIALAVLEECQGNLEGFIAAHKARFRHYQGLRSGLQGAALVNLHPLTVIARALESILG